MKTKTIKEKTKEAIEKLSDRRVKLILDFIEYLNEKEEWEATEELLQDRKTVETYKEAKRDLKEGKKENFIPWEKRNKVDV